MSVLDFPNLSGVTHLGFDTETTGLKYWARDFSVFGVALATHDAQWYFDVRETPGLFRWLRDILPGKTLIAHNAQFDYQAARAFGIDPRSMNWYCTMVAQCLIFEHDLGYSLTDVAAVNGVFSRKYEILDGIQAAMEWSSRDETMRRLPEAPSHMVAEYGASDARDVYDIWRKQCDEIKRQKLEGVVELEMELLPVLADMSWGGIRVNTEAAEASIPLLDAKEVQIAQEIKELTNCKDASTFVNSPKQMREFFNPEPINKYQWRLIDGTLVGPTKGGKGPSLGQDALRQMRHPVAAKILDLRKTIKLRDTFIRGHVLGSADEKGYVHTQFNQTRNDADAGTVTGRLSSVDPALQQITKRDKANAAILRALFLPDDGKSWGCMDYSQVDFRCAAHLINDPNIIQAYRDDPKLDYHQVVSDMTGIPRNPPYAGAPNTKQINLGMAFGAGAGKVAFMMGMDYELTEYRGRMAYIPGNEAKRIFELYHGKLPGVKTFMKHAEQVAKDRGYVRTLTGRRLRFFTTGGQHKAAGLLYQAYAADLHKIGLIKVDRVIREEKLDARLMMSCHDEIGVSKDPNDQRAHDLIMQNYTDFDENSPTAWVKMRVPIMASGDYGPNWYEASKN